MDIATVYVFFVVLQSLLTKILSKVTNSVDFVTRQYPQANYRKLKIKRDWKND